MQLLHNLTLFEFKEQVAQFLIDEQSSGIQLYPSGLGTSPFKQATQFRSFLLKVQLLQFAKKVLQLLIFGEMHPFFYLIQSPLQVEQTFRVPETEQLLQFGILQTSWHLPLVKV